MTSSYMPSVWKNILAISRTHGAAHQIKIDPYPVAEQLLHPKATVCLIQMLQSRPTKDRIEGQRSRRKTPEFL